MTEQQIKALIEQHGFSMRIHERVSTRGDGTVSTQILLYRCGMKFAIYLGALRRLQAMNEAQVIALIASKQTQIEAQLARKSSEHSKEHKAGKAIVLKARNQ